MPAPKDPTKREEWLAKLRKSLSERGHKPDCNCCMCEAKRGENKGENNPQFGKHHSEETLVKMRKPRSEEACANIKEGCKKRPPLSKELREKVGEAQRGVSKPSKLKGRTYKDIYGDKSEEMCLKHRGENNGMWQGGCSNMLHPEEFRKMQPIIREWDIVCQVCGRTLEESLELWGEKLSVHHIDYDPNNNDPDNLVSLCRNCHGKTTSGDREYWQNYFEVCWLIPNKQLLEVA